MGEAYRTHQKLGKISKALLFLDAGVSFVSEYNRDSDLSTKEKIVNSSVEAVWSVGSGIAIGATIGSIVSGAGTVARAVYRI